jgi:hypothetical protein
MTHIDLWVRSLDDHGRNKGTQQIKRKIVRKIGPIKGECSRITGKEIKDILQGEDIVKFTKSL